MFCNTPNRQIKVLAKSFFYMYMVRVPMHIRTYICTRHLPMPVPYAYSAPQEETENLNILYIYSVMVHGSETSFISINIGIHYHFVMWLSRGENDGDINTIWVNNIRPGIFLNIRVKVWKCGTLLLLISSICEPTFIKQTPAISAWQQKMLVLEDLWR